MTIEEYASIRATSELVGRDKILSDIYDAIKEKSKVPHVFYITAPGGWGKTRLMDEILRKVDGKKGGEWWSSSILSASRLVDLYHTSTHSIGGIIAEIVEVLDDETRSRFGNYLFQLAELDSVKYDLSQTLLLVEQQRAKMMDSFIEDFNDIGNKFNKIILAFDTVENLVYETDRVQTALGLSDEPIGVAGWLVQNFLPNLHNTVVLIAGRPELETPQLKMDLEKLGKSGKIMLTRIELGAFSEEETLAYFNAVLEVARKENPNIAKRLARIPQETWQVVHYFSGGQPFLLSLFVDYLAIADELLPEVRLPLNEVRKLANSQEGLQKEQNEFRDAILQEFQKIRRPLDEIVRALSWTPRGMGAELLAWIMKRDQPTEDEIEQAEKYIQILRDPKLRLSFVKIRDVDHLVFLQDEMYNLLRSLYQRGRLQHNVKQTYQLIVNFYKERIKDQAKQVEDLQKTTTALVSSGLISEFTETQNLKLLSEQQSLRQARARLQSYKVEHVYYSLQFNYVKGVQAYTAAAEAAFQDNDTDLWLLLRDELLKFAKPLRSNVNEQEALNYIDGDIGVRWIKYNIAKGAYEKAFQQIKQFRKECPDLVHDGSFADFTLKIGESTLLNFLGQELSRAQEILRDLFVSLNSKGLYDKFEPEFDEWRTKLITAYAQDKIGYLYRSQGDFSTAVDIYRKNIRLWRDLRFESEQATTLNNLSWALAELGEFQAATRCCEDGLNLRRKLGYRYQVGLSLNTLGLIETRWGQPERARFRCEQALGIFRDLEIPRGIGLACTALAESLRRMTNIPDLLSVSQSMKNLELAEQNATEAIGIFTDYVKEPMRLTEAYIELGCIYREMIRLLPSNNILVANLIEKGKEAFDNAVQSAGTEFAYRGVDARVNLAWMYYYVDNFNEAEKILNDLNIEEQYFIKQDKPSSMTNTITPWYWVQLGKANLLLGKMAFDKYKQANTQQAVDEVKMQLKKAAHYWMLSIAYNEKYRPDFRDLIRGRQEIYNCLRVLNFEEMKWVKDGIKQAYEMYDTSQGLESFEKFINEQFV